MKKLIYFLGISMLLLSVSCVKKDLNDEIETKYQSVDKDKVKSPGGQSGSKG